MKRALPIASLLLPLCLPAGLHAGDMPVPKIFRDSPMEKGQWRVEMLEMKRGSETTPGPRTMTVCMDAAKDMAKANAGRKEADGCASKILTDTADMAVVEANCSGEIYRSTMKREGAGRFYFETQSSGKAEPMSMKARYTYEGACKEGAGVIGFDRNSAECKQLQARLAEMNPATQCANAGAQRKMCEDQVRKARAQMEAMCR